MTSSGGVEERLKVGWFNSFNDLSDKRMFRGDLDVEEIVLVRPGLSGCLNLRGGACGGVMKSPGFCARTNGVFGAMMA